MLKGLDVTMISKQWKDTWSMLCLIVNRRRKIRAENKLAFGIRATMILSIYKGFSAYCSIYPIAQFIFKALFSTYTLVSSLYTNIPSN